VRLKTLFLLAAVSLAACSGGDTPEPQSQAPAADAAAARQAPPATDAAQAAPTPAPAAAPAAPATDEQPAQIAQANADSPSAVDSSRFKEGASYQRLSPAQPTSTGPDQVEVAEFFMYSCPHCYNFDPYVQDWLKTLPSYVNFIRVPTVWNPMVKLHAQAYYTAEALGKLDEMHTAFFREMHVNGNYMQTEDAVADFFGKFGVSQDEFKRTFDSFAVHAKVQRADELARRYGVSATPTMVVNGKYVTNASMTGGYDSLLELVGELAASEHAAN
jgi:thiol:disulfide interchange protein DsbA